MRQALKTVLGGDFVDRPRIVRHSVVLLVAYACLAVWLLSGEGMRDPLGKPLGTDFLSFFSVSRILRGPSPALAYSPAYLGSVEQAVGGAGVPFYAWFYPPIALLVVYPLAALPYGCALLAWSVLGVGAYLLLARAIVPDRAGVLAAAAFPAVPLTLGHGQNALFVAALLGAALFLIDRRPSIAGVLLGLAAFKPHFAVLIAVGLLVARRWKAAAAAVATVSVLGATTILMFGTDVWSAFFASAAMARDSLESGLVGHHKMQSAFSGARLLGMGSPIAWGVQLGVTAAMVLVAAKTCSSRVDARIRNAVLLVSAVLATPFVLDYDLALVGPAIACLASYGIQNGFAPGERLVLAASWWLPLVARPVAEYLRIPLTPLVLATFLACLFQRVRAEGARNRGAASAPSA
jgi:hypothetical protein